MAPVVFHLATPFGFVPVYSYGILLGLSLIAIWYFLLYVGVRKEHFNRSLAATSLVAATCGALVGARVLYWALNGEADGVSAWALGSGGLHGLGGIGGGLLGAYLYLRRRGVPVLAWADAVAPSLGLGAFLTEIGCWLHGSGFGTVLATSAPRWLKRLGTYPRWGSELFRGAEAHREGAAAFYHHVSVPEYAARLSADADASLPVHPTQLYAALAGLVLFGLGWKIFRTRVFRGQVILAIVAGLAATTFFFDFWVADPSRAHQLGLSPTQWVALGATSGCAISYAWLRRRFRRDGDPRLPEFAVEKTSPAAPFVRQAGA